MAHIHLITGGQRSGKSSFAQNIVLKKSNHPLYIATSRLWDEDHAQRIRRHQSDRGDQWETIEEEVHLSTLDIDNRIVVLDCITLWLTNIFFDLEGNVEKSLAKAKEEWNLFSKKNAEIYVITNEIGMGGHPTNSVQIKFTDVQGWMNQYIAREAETVTLMVSGIPVKIK
jgi:adenosylcobinamide kinase / adenosylcobinamide-phosphate guanylyltransferase